MSCRDIIGDEPAGIAVVVGQYLDICGPHDSLRGRIDSDGLLARVL